MAPGAAGRQAAPAFRADIEGLRAVAVLLVVLFHAGVPGLGGGYVGVDVFFVLSGFLITELLLRERASAGSTSLPRFYARRVRRILPAATLVLAATVLAGYQWLGFLRAGVIASDGQWTALFAANFHLATQGTQYFNALEAPSPLQHYWSLAVEEQFYLVYPLLFLLLATVAPATSVRRKLVPALLLVVVASFAWCVLQTNTDLTWAFFSPLTRAWELGVGALLAVAAPLSRRIPPLHGGLLSWLGVAGVLVSGLFLGGVAFPGFAAALPVLSTAAVVAGGAPGATSGAWRVLSLPPLQWLGKLSYSLYLWHWPILAIAAEYAGRTLSLRENLECVALALVLSIGMFLLIENPIRYARPLMRHSVASLGLGVFLLVAAFGLCTWEIQSHAGTDSAASTHRPAASAASHPSISAVPGAAIVERSDVRAR